MPVTMPAAGASLSYMSEGGERRELEERRAGIEQPLDALADRQLALLAMALEVLRAAALARRRAMRSRSSRDELLHALAVGCGRLGSDAR